MPIRCRSLLAGLALGAGFAAAAQPVVDANTATRAELDAITGIGPSLAERIVAERQNAPFRSLADLQSRVRGVGEANLRKMRDSGLVIGRALSAGGTETIVGGTPEARPAPRHAPRPPVQERKPAAR